MLFGRHAALVGGFALIDGGQAGGIFALIVVGALVVDSQEAVEQHHLPRGAQPHLSVGRADLDGGALHPRGLHLAGKGALPDQVVKLALFGFDVQPVGRQHHVGGADTLMRLLRVLGLVLVHPRRFRDVIGTEPRLDRVTRGHHRLGRHVDAVGPHIGDIARLIQPLRRRHAGPRAQPQLAAGLLLQGRGHEGRPRVAAGGFRGNRGHRQVAAFHRRDRQTRSLLIRQVIAFQLFPGIGHQLRPVFLPARRRQNRVDGPVFAGAERLDLHLAVDDDAQGHRLDAAGGFRAGQLAPQHRRQVEPDQIIQRAARQIGIDHRLVDLARIGHRLGHGGLGDGVEGDAADLRALFQGRGQRFQQMPGNRLALAVGVGGEDQFGIVLQRVPDRLDVFFRIRRDFPFHGEIGVGIDRAVLGRQVADMAERGQNRVVVAKIFVDRLGLGGGFDDDDWHGGPFRRFGPRTWAGRAGLSTCQPAAALGDRGRTGGFPPHRRIRRSPRIFG